MSVLCTDSKLWKCGEKILSDPQFVTYIMGCVSVCLSALLIQSFQVPFSDMSLTDHLSVCLLTQTSPAKQSPLPKKPVKLNSFHEASNIKQTSRGIRFFAKVIHKEIFTTYSNHSVIASACLPELPFS